MNTYETSAVVEDQGRIRVEGVPFAPGTEVQILIRAKDTAGTPRTQENVEQASVRVKELLAALQGRNTEPVGPLRREELYDRKVFR